MTCGVAPAYGDLQLNLLLPRVQAKFWPTASRVDNVHGDRHLIAKLPPVSTTTDTVSEPMAASVGGN